MEGDGGANKEGINGEVDEESNGKVKEGEAAACGSKLRACRRAGTGEGSGAGTEMGVCWHREEENNDFLHLANSTFPYVKCFTSLLFSPAAAGCGGSGSSNGEEKAGKAEGDAGPSCSSLSKDAGDAKSRFFDDSEESEEGEEEEGSDEEVREQYLSKPVQVAVRARSLALMSVTRNLFFPPSLLGWQRRGGGG